MKYKSKMGNGLAFTPEKDMKLFSKMAKQGYHLCGFNIIGKYKFKKGEEKDYIFSYTAEKNPDEDYIAYFTDAGWEAVILQPHLQIFRALPGTQPIYSNTETLVDFYKKEVNLYTKYAIGTTIFFIISCYLAISFLEDNILGLILFVIGLIPFVWTVLPLGAFIYHYRKYIKQSN